MLIQPLSIMQLKLDTLLQGGKYRIIRTLGQGGFGITYEAEQVLLRRKVAVKEFFMKDCCERDDATSRVTIGTGNQRALAEKFRGKFIREAQMIAGMDNPHIVRVLDVFEENGTAYYVMDYLPGGSLADKVKNYGPLAEKKAESYIQQVADALAYIHSLNTVHLDIKPSNVLLNAKDEAVLVDFGISKHYDDSGEQTSSTPVGISKGYAPLEQGRDGDVSQFGPSTDIYALGGTLYYLVTGIVPPEASIINEDGLLRPKGISDRLWQVIEKSMRPRRKDRPQSIQDLLALLNSPSAQEDTSDETIINVSYNDTEPKRRVGKSRTWVWGLLGVLAVFISLLCIFSDKAKDGEKKEVGPDTVNVAGAKDPGDLVLEEPAKDSPGSIKVTSEPSNATIWLDGKNTKTKTPGVLNDILPGKHTLRLVLDGYAENKSSITVISGQQSSKTIKLVAIPEKDESEDLSGWVNLGLPSGTLWRDKNEAGFFTYNQAVNRFGKSLPSRAQFDELRSSCKWTWQGSGYWVTGPSGKTIYLPAAGWRESDVITNIGDGGFYWSSTPDLPDIAWYLLFSSGGVYTATNWRSYGQSVRLVQVQ